MHVLHPVEIMFRPGDESGEGFHLEQDDPVRNPDGVVDFGRSAVDTEKDVPQHRPSACFEFRGHKSFAEPSQCSGAELGRVLGLTGILLPQSTAQFLSGWNTDRTPFAWARPAAYRREPSHD